MLNNDEFCKASSAAAAAEEKPLTKELRTVLEVRAT